MLFNSRVDSIRLKNTKRIKPNKIANKKPAPVAIMMVLDLLGPTTPNPLALSNIEDSGKIEARAIIVATLFSNKKRYIFWLT